MNDANLRKETNLRKTENVLKTKKKIESRENGTLNRLMVIGKLRVIKIFSSLQDHWRV